MKTKGTILLFVLLVNFVVCLHMAVEEKKLKAKNGMYLTACSFCPEKNFGTARSPKFVKLNIFVGQGQPTYTSVWQIERLDGNYVRIKNKGTDRYLAWCQDECKMGVPITIISKDSNVPNTKFQMQLRDDQKYAFKGSNGKYLGLCNGCLSGGFLEYKGVNYVGLVDKEDKNDEWAGWELEG